MTDRVIPAEAVEAAARGLAVQAWGEWEYVPDDLRRLFLRDAKIALESAAPHMQAASRQAAIDAYFNVEWSDIDD